MVRSFSRSLLYDIVQNYVSVLVVGLLCRGLRCDVPVSPKTFLVSTRSEVYGNFASVVRVCNIPVEGVGTRET